jgi:site-specific DNA-methyltransferase (adenine-specific)
MIYNEDCIEGAKKYLKDSSVDLIICDPPFGIDETTFHKHYNRDESNVLEGYVEAPDDYAEFSHQWMEQAKRVLKDDGSFYVFSGWTNLIHILNAGEKLGLYTINHIIWKYNFGLNTKNKFVTSHYHVLFYKKIKNNKFNTFSRFGQLEKDKHGKSLLYKDLEDVWMINKEYQPGEIKNKNKLPEAIIEKIILYSSNEEDIVVDFFLGNFTTASVAKKLNRISGGFEINELAYKERIKEVEQINKGSGLELIRKPDKTIIPNQGKRLSKEDRDSIYGMYEKLRKNMSKKDAINTIGKEFGRGRFGITNVIKKFEE